MMCKLNHQALKKTQPSYETSRKYQQVVVKISQIAALGLLLGTANILVTQKVIAQEARTTTKNVTQVNLAVNRQAEETYESLLTRAESVAMSALKQRFHQDKHTPAVSVIIVGHNQGAIAPVLSVEVDRNQWRKAQTKDQIKFFATARQLLGFEGLGIANTSPATNSNPVENSENISGDDTEIEMPDATSAGDEFSETDNVQAPAIVPVDTPTPEVPGMVPVDSSTSEVDSTQFAPVVPSSNPAAVDANAVPPTTNNLTPQIPTSPTPNNLTQDSIPDASGGMNNNSMTTPTIP